MCTVTFIPFNGTFFITSIRDENPERRSNGLISFHPPGKNIIHYPLDEESGGSWIALTGTGKITCLLNGGFEPFIPNPPYRQSRGQVVIDAALENNTQHFLKYYNLNEIAPFTLLIFEKEQLDKLVWDGHVKHITALPVDRAQIWSSVTLYSPQIRAWRKSLFENWLKENAVFERDSIIQFHLMTNGDFDNDFIMNRNELVKTLSITNIVLRPAIASIMHLDLKNSRREEILVKYE